MKKEQEEMMTVEYLKAYNILGYCGSHPWVNLIAIAVVIGLMVVLNLI